MICILAALKKEIDSFLDILNKVKKKKVSGLACYHGSLHEKDVCIIKTGVNRHDIDPAIFNNCTEIISTGFCGALIPELKAGDIVVSAEVLSADNMLLDKLFKDNKGQASVDMVPVEKIPSVEGISKEIMSFFQNEGILVHCVRTVTAARVIKNYNEKTMLHAATGAVSVDMEDCHRIKLAKRLGTRFISIRSVFDELHDEVPGFKSGFIFHSSLPSLLKKLSAAQEGIALSLEKMLEILI